MNALLPHIDQLSYPKSHTEISDADDDVLAATEVNGVGSQSSQNTLSDKGRAQQSSKITGGKIGQWRCVEQGAREEHAHRDEDQLHEEPDEPQDGEASGRAEGYFRKLCTPTPYLVNAYVEQY